MHSSPLQAPLQCPRCIASTLCNPGDVIFGFDYVVPSCFICPGCNTLSKASRGFSRCSVNGPCKRPRCWDCPVCRDCEPERAKEQEREKRGRLVLRKRALVAKLQQEIEALEALEEEEALEEP